MASAPMLECKQRRRCDNIKAESRDLDTFLCLKKKLQITPRMVDILHHDWSILTVYVDYFLLSFNLMYLFILHPDCSLPSLLSFHLFPCVYSSFVQIQYRNLQLSARAQKAMFVLLLRSSESQGIRG